LLETAVENNVTVIHLPSHSTPTLQPLDEGIFGPLKSYFKKEAAVCKSPDIAWRASLDFLGLKLFPRVFP